jgi:hypothetical protein
LLGRRPAKARPGAGGNDEAEVARCH